jgi:hypothetical protein
MEMQTDTDNASARRQTCASTSVSNEMHPRPGFSRVPSISLVDDHRMRNTSSFSHQPALVSPCYYENEYDVDVESLAGVLLLPEERIPLQVNSNTSSMHASDPRRKKHRRDLFSKPSASLDSLTSRYVSSTNSNSSVNLPKADEPGSVYPRDEAVTGSAASVLMLMKLSGPDDGRFALATVAAVNNEGPAVDSRHNAAENIRPRQLQLRLALPEDHTALNILHCFVRSHLLEIFSDTASTGVQRVGLRCVHCAHVPRKDGAQTKMAMFFPKSLEDLYRKVCRWQGLHFHTCPYIPARVIEEYNKLKESDKSRGNTQYWISSAERLGLVNIVDCAGICFAPACSTLPSDT